MSEIVALIAYMRNEDIDEILWTFSDVEQARKYFDDNIKSPKDFYESPSIGEEQAISLFILDKKATLTWSVDEKIIIHTSGETAK